MFPKIFNLEYSYTYTVNITTLSALFILFMLFIIILIGFYYYGKTCRDTEWLEAASNGKIMLRNKKRHGYKVSLVYTSNNPMDIPHS